MSYQQDPNDPWGQQPGGAPPPPQAWGDQPAYGGQQSPYQPYPNTPYGNQGFGVPQKQSSVLSTLSIVFGCIALLIVPPLFGIAGLVCGIVAKTKDQPRATLGIIISAAGLILGMVLGIVVAHTVV